MKNIIRYLRILFLHLFYRGRSSLLLPESAVIIAPHPDDEVIGCAGLIQALVQRGTPPHIIIMTGGENSHSICCDLSKEVIINERRRLTLDAAKTLGLPQSHIHTLNYPDGGIVLKYFETEKVGQLVSRLSPDAVFVPHWGEGWNDHINTAEIVKKLIADKNISIYEYCVWMWYYNVWNLDNKNARILKMSCNQHQSKLRAIEQYIVPKAPCGKPWSGVLPNPFLYAAKWNRELYFRVR